METNQRLRGNHVLLRAGTLRLLLPQHEVGPALHVEEADDVIALSERMALLPERPQGRHVACTLGNVGDGSRAWCWDDLRVLIEADLPLHAIPAALLGAGTPVRRFALVDGDVAYACDARTLAAFAMGVA